MLASVCKIGAVLRVSRTPSSALRTAIIGVWMTRPVTIRLLLGWQQQLDLFPDLVGNAPDTVHAGAAAIRFPLMSVRVLHHILGLSDRLLVLGPVGAHGVDNRVDKDGSNRLVG